MKGLAHELTFWNCTARGDCLAAPRLALPIRTFTRLAQVQESGSACGEAKMRRIGDDKHSVASLVANKVPRPRFLMRDGLTLTYARSLPFCFFSRQVEASFEPAIIELERHTKAASCLFRQHLR